MAVTTVKQNAASVTGTWAVNGADTPTYSAQRYANLCTGNNTPTVTCRWQITGLTGGVEYLVAIAIPFLALNRAVDQSWKMFDSDGTTELRDWTTNGAVANNDFTYTTGQSGSGTVVWMWVGKYTPTGTSLTVYTDNTGANTAKYAVADAVYCIPVSDGYTPVYSPFGTGNWADSTTWRTGDIPATNTAVTFKASSPTTVTVAANLTQGPTGAAGTVALTIPDYNSLIVADGVTMTVLGDVALSGSSTSRISGQFPIVVGTGSTGGAILEFDGTASTAKYRIRPTVDLAANAYVKMRGIDGNPAIIRSASGSPNAWFDYNSNRGFAIDAQFGTLLRIGDATNPSLSIYPALTFPSTLTDCTLDACGAITPGGTAHYVTYTRVVMINTVASASMTTGAGGLTTIADCRFDKILNFYGPPTLAITGTYLGGGQSLVSPYTASTYTDNLINAYSDHPGIRTLSDCYYFYDVGDNNPHPHTVSPGSGTVTGCIFDAPRGTVGDMIVGGAGLGNTTTATGCIVIPNAVGTSPGELASPIAAGLWSVNHNTVCTTDAQGTAAESGVAVYGETYAGASAMYASLRSNIAWTPSGKGAFLLRHILSTVSDVVANSAGNILADYNCGNDLVTATGSGVVAVYGANGGYVDTTVAPSVAMFTSTTGLGVNDIVADPQFVDATRNLATFDSAYLGNSPASWADATPYAVGDYAKAQTSGFYGNAIINYRCKVAHTSVSGNATTGQPGVAANWRTNWEFASIYRLRTTAATYNASVLQATPKDLTLWVKGGWAPTNITLQNAGHDGVTIGAVEYVAAASTTNVVKKWYPGLRRRAS